MTEKRALFAVLSLDLDFNKTTNIFVSTLSCPEEMVSGVWKPTTEVFAEGR